MADIVTGTVTGQVDQSQLLMGQAAIRQEQAAFTADIRRDTASEAGAIVDAVKTSGWTNAETTVSNADRIVAQDTAYFIAGQAQNFSNATALAGMTATTNASFAQTLAAIQLASSQGTAATNLAASQTQTDLARGQVLLTQAIMTDGNATRALINQQTIDELRFSNLRHYDHHGHHGCHHERAEGVLNYGPPVSATYPV